MKVEDPREYFHRIIQNLTLLCLPKSLLHQMELSEKVRKGDVDLPNLKVGTFDQYHQIRIYVLLNVVGVLLATLSLFATSFTSPTPLDYLSKVLFALGTMFCIQRSFVDIKRFLFVVFLIICGAFYLLVQQESLTSLIPPLVRHLSQFTFIPLLACYMIRGKAALVIVAISVGIYFVNLFDSTHLCFPLTPEERTALMINGTLMHLLPVWILRSYESEMKVYHTLLEKFLERSEEKGKEKTSFISRMSHELRTPLHGLLSSANLMRQTLLSQEQSTFLTTIDSCGEVILDVISKILDITKIESGDLEQCLSGFSLFEVVRVASQAVALQAHAKGLDIRMFFDLHPQGFDVKGDKQLVTEILMNLIVNAVKFTQQGTVSIKVARRDAKWPHYSTYYFEISDTGLGIAESDLARLWSPFAQIHLENNRKIEGAGLGLAIAKRTTEALKGRMGVTSAIGTGSTFWFELPLESLPPNTYAPPLNSIPFNDPVALTQLAQTLGSNEQLAGVKRLFIATNVTDVYGNLLWQYLRNWGVDQEYINSEQHVEAYLKKGHSLFMINEDTNLLTTVLRKSRAPESSAAKISVVLYVKLTDLSRANKIAEQFLSTARISVIVKPPDPARICKAILFLLGSEVFRFEQTKQDLPDPSHKPANLAPEPLNSSSSSPSSDAIEALVVEDNRVNQMIMSKVLDGLNIKYRITPSGDEGLEIWRSSLTPIPLVFMDVEIEGTIDGLVATRRIREAEAERDKDREEAGFPPLPRSFIAVMTGRAMESDKLEALECGCNEFMTKPVDLNLLRKIITSRIKRT